MTTSEAARSARERGETFQAASSPGKLAIAAIANRKIAEPDMTIERTDRGWTVLARSEAETEAIGAAIAEFAKPGTVIALVGPLGAGKTRLSRAIAEALGADPAAIASPTYVLIHEYEARIPVYHFDTYRLADPDEFDALGASEYFAGDGVCLVEWADRVADRLPKSAWWIAIEPEGDSGRRFRLEGPGPWDEIAARPDRGS